MDARPIEPGSFNPGQNPARPAQPVRAWAGKSRLRAFLVAYAVYLVLCFGIEGGARLRFGVHAPAPGAESLPQKERLHRELEQIRARGAMGKWPPYELYSLLVAALSVAGCFGGAFLVGRRVFRAHRPGMAALGHKVAIMGILLAMTAGLFLFLGPPLLAAWVWETFLLTPV